MAQPNYHDPQSRRATLSIITIILTSISFIMVMLRGYLRIYILRNFGLDDLFIGLALITGIASAVLVILVNSRYDFNRHVWDVPPAVLSQGEMITIPASLTIACTLAFIRISLCCFYRRLLEWTGREYYRRVIPAVIFFVVMLLTGLLIGIALQCRPLRALWDLAPTYQRSCISENNFNLSTSILGVIADFTCLVLPMPLIWQMSLPRKDRTSIVFLLGLGIIACGAGLVRTVLQQASSRTQGSPHLDVTWATWPFFLAVEIEINVGIFCACASATRPLFTSHLPSFNNRGLWTRFLNTVGIGGCVRKKKNPTRRSEISSTTDNLESQLNPN